MKDGSVKFTNAEMRLLIEDLNRYCDAGMYQVINDRGETVEVRSMLKKILIAALYTGAAKLPSCFTGDQELMDAAAAADLTRNFDIDGDVVPDTTTVH